MVLPGRARKFPSLCILTVDDHDAVRLGHDTADALEAAAAGHRVVDQRIERHVLDCAVGRLGDHLVDGLIFAESLIDETFLRDGLGRSGGIELIGSFGIEPGDSAAESEALGCDYTAVRGSEALAQDAGVVLVYALVAQR